MSGGASRRERLLSGPHLAEVQPPSAALSVPTAATDVLLAAYATLSVQQQDALFAAIHEKQLQSIAGDESEAARFLRSLRRVAEYVGGELSPDNYRAARKELIAEGEEIAELSSVVRFWGSWRLAKEALAMSAISTPFKIEARFRARLLGKVHRYTDEKLEDVMAEAVVAIGRVPLLIEFELWRQKEMEIAKAQGKELFLPSDSPYRRRWGSWEGALVHFGYDIADIKARLEPGRERSTEAAKLPRRQRA